MALASPLRWLHLSSLAVYRALTWTVLIAGFAFAATIIALRYWILPNVGDYREDIAQRLSRAAGQQITIGRISGNWHGLRPELILENVVVLDRAGKPALELSRVDQTLSWLSVAMFDLRYHSLEIHRPVLSIRRDPDGRLHVAGVDVSGGDGDGGLLDWLLRQREVLVHDARIAWNDEVRGAPPIEVQNLSMQMRNSGRRHRFGLSGVPPAHLASPLDLRGEFYGDSLRSLAKWSGRLFVQLDYADIAAWRTWVPFPIEFPRGAGALRMWLAFSDKRFTELTADVRLAGVETRLGADLPQLTLDALSGRVAWKQTPTSFEFSTTQLGLVTAGGLALQPADFLLRLQTDRQGAPSGGELRANALSLEPLASLADHLPVDPELRERLLQLRPKGSLHDIVLRWSGDWREPHQYTVRGHFEQLALARSAKLPGFSGATGNIDGTEKGGTMYVNSSGARLDMPRIFREPLQFDTLTAQLGWGRRGTEVELRLNNVAFTNSHLAGTLFGRYQTVAGSAGIIDLTGNLTRADGRFAARYIPLMVAKSARTWLDAAFLGGTSSDVSLRLRGNLDDFPFRGSKRGLFEVIARVSDVVLHYADGWPRIENIAGDLTFRGERMDINTRQGTIMGVRLGRVHAEIPDLEPDIKHLRVSGEAEGPTGEFLRFIETSPVTDMIDRFTEGKRATGNGRLALKLDIPLRGEEKVKVAGAYQFFNNRVLINDLPPIEQVNGKLEFSEAMVRLGNTTGVFLGGPLTLSASTQRDGAIVFAGKGRANIDNLRRSAGSPAWSQHVRGGADWNGSLTLRKKTAELSVRSSLLGIASDLPAPFVKTAGMAVPLRYEHRFAESRENIGFAYGDIVSARLVRATEKGATALTRGTVRFGGAAEEPARDGLWVSGRVGAFDLDRWMGLLPGNGGEGVQTPRAQTRVGGIDLKIDELVALGRRFHDLDLSGTAQQEKWEGTVAARELEGAVTWQPRGRGKLVARMTRLTIPRLPVTAPAVATAKPASAARAEWPAVDVVAEQFRARDLDLGRFELVAIPREKDWRVEKVSITNPESTFAADGVWRTVAGSSRTEFNLRLDVKDTGKLLGRLGHPEGVRGGTAKLEGALNWPGSPQDFDYPVLSGNFVLEAAKGQFVKLEPGIGKLLGILSLQALPRRISLDFRDIFTEGFAFDEILGSIKISKGIASTENLRIAGPAARVTMSGEVDLDKETQRLKVRVSPSLSEGVSIAGALIGGPVAGVAAYLAQKVLKDPIEQLASYQYSIAGTWNEPVVSKLGAEAEARDAEKDKTP